MSRNDDTISRQAAIVQLSHNKIGDDDCDVIIQNDIETIKALPSAQPESTRTFVELVVKYPDPELCAYKEYKGKPYYSIKYIENGETYVGYGTYNPEVLSQYLKEYFISSVQTEIIHCRDCKHYYYADNRIPQEQRYTCDLDGDRWQPDSFCSFAEGREE